LAVEGIKRAVAAVAITCGFALPQVALAESFNVPPGWLGDVATALGVQARVTIALREPDLASKPSPGVRGQYSLREALGRALRGTGAKAIFHDRSTIQIVREKRSAAFRAPVPIVADEPSQIVVTASKQNIPLDRYPGSVKLVELEQEWLADHAAEGTAAITRLLPALGSTNLGAGRNKLFIRGIADSSFSGPTQAATGQYLGDVRLNYAAPDPDLNLYDMKRIEVLVGPQGALYGASSLGGVIRLVPNMPDPHEASASMAANIGTTRHGGTSVDGATMLNLPLIDGRLAARLVFFGEHSAGYIDAPASGRRDINDTARYGQRLSLRAQDIGGWTLDLGIVLQNIASDDGQYTLRGDPPLTRDTVIRQPFHNDYRLGYLTATRQLGNAELVSTTAIARHDLKSVFDATGIDGTPVPARYIEGNDITLFTHETRLAGGGQRSPWVFGAGLLVNDSKLTLSLEQPEIRTREGAVTNIQAEAAAFGQVSRSLTSTLTGTIGGRLTFAASHQRLGGNLTEEFDPTRTDLRFAGIFAIDWHPGGPLSAFFRYQQGYRAGGLGISLSESALEVRKFEPDDLHMNELGIRLGDKVRDRFSMRAAIFIADWRNIQADLISDFGPPFTTNIGRGIIHGLDGEITWRPWPMLTLSASAFLNDSKLSDPADGFSVGNGKSSGSIARTLPNIARNGSRIAAAWRGPVGRSVIFSAEASLRYVGLSHLGFGPKLDVSQGDYLVADLGGRLDFGRFALWMNILNASDTRANTFAYGNPFSLAQGTQITPLRPRTVRLGISARF
jgi:iron complex outermembrane receptor protein